MAVFVKVQYDTEDADKQLADSQASLAANYEKLGEIAHEALKLDKIKDAFEGLKDTAETWLPLLGDENSQLSGLIDKGLKLGEAGAKIGAFFGPWGAAIGAALGALSSLYAFVFENDAKLEKEAKEAREALEKQKEETIDAAIETRHLVEALEDLDKTSLSGVVSALSQTQDEIKKTKDAIDAAQGSAVGMVDRWLALIAVQEGNVIDARAALLDAISAGANQIDDTLDRSTAKTSDLKDEADKAKGKLEGLQKDLGRLYKGLDDIHDQDAAKEAVKATNAVLAEIDKQTSIYTAAKDELQRRGEKALDDKKKLQENETEADRAFGAGIVAWDKQYDQEQLDANAEFERQLADSKEQWRLQEIEDEIAANKQLIEIEKDLAEKTQAIAEQRAIEASEAYKEQVDKIKGYLQPLVDVVGKSFDLIAQNIAKGEKPLAGYGNALRGMLADILAAYAKKWGIQAVGEFAEGLAWAVSPIPGARDVAAGHFASAATFGLAATLAGGASILAGRNTQVPAPASSSGDTSGGASLGGGGSNFSLGSRDRGEASMGGNIQVVLSGNMFLDGDDRSLAKAGHKLGAAIGASKRDLRLDTGVH